MPNGRASFKPVRYYRSNGLDGTLVLQMTGWITVSPDRASTSRRPGNMDWNGGMMRYGPMNYAAPAQKTDAMDEPVRMAVMAMLSRKSFV